MGSKQPSLWSIAFGSPWLYFLVPAGIVGTIALLNYIRYEGVRVPVLVALAGSAVLLLFGYWLWRPLVRFGYGLMWAAVWLGITSLVLRLFAFGPLVGVLGAGLWVMVSVIGIPVLVMGYNEGTELEEQKAARQREEEQRQKAATPPSPDERRVYSPQNCVACGADLTQRPVTTRRSRRVHERADDAPAGHQRLVELVVEERQCACGQRTVALFPDRSRRPEG